MMVINNNPFELNIKCHTIDLGTLVYDVQFTTDKRKYTMTDLIEDYGYEDPSFAGLDYAPYLDEDLGAFSFKFGDGIVTFRLTNTSKCTIEELD